MKSKSFSHFVIIPCLLQAAIGMEEVTCPEF